MIMILQQAKNDFVRTCRTIWDKISRNTFVDVIIATSTDSLFNIDIRTSRDAKLHLKKKHFSLIVRKVVNDLLSDRGYKVKKVRYRLRGLDIFVTKK